MRFAAVVIAVIVTVAAATCQADSTGAPLFASHAQAGAEYSYYIGTLQSKLKATAAIADSYFTRIRRDSQKSDLQSFSQDSKDLLTAMENENNALAALAPRIFLAQSDSKYFDASRDAAQAITGSDVDIARDLAARTRFDAAVNTDLMTAGTQKSALTKQFKTVVLRGYQFFGHSRAAVDMSSLTLKR
jgi:hypothetical protein